MIYDIELTSKHPVNRCCIAAILNLPMLHSGESVNFIQKDICGNYYMHAWDKLHCKLVNCITMYYFINLNIKLTLPLPNFLT